MAQNDTNLLEQATLDKLTREKASMILIAIKAGGELNTQEMVRHVGVYLNDEQALAELVQRSARGENAMFDLMQRIALETGERQARKELAEKARNAPSIADRIHRFLGSIAA